MGRIGGLLLVAGLQLCGCWARSREPLFTFPASRPTTDPALVLEQVQRAMNQRDLGLYESLLDDRFLFVETDCQGRMFDLHDRAQELALVGGSGGSAQPGVFRAFAGFSFDLSVVEHRQEAGAAQAPGPKADGGHPGETWEVYVTRVRMRMTSARGDTLPSVDTILTYKLRLDPARRWRIVRAVNSPLPEDCARAVPDSLRARPRPR
jgi:hypothetical protein